MKQQLYIKFTNGKSLTLHSDTWCWNFEDGCIKVWKADKKGTKIKGIPMHKVSGWFYEEVE